VGVRTTGDECSYEPNFSQGLTIDTNELPSIANSYDTTNGRVLWRTDAANNRKTKTNGNNQVTTYGYDANNRVTSVTFQNATKYLHPEHG
jgi:YD repeat-containing protein